MIFDNEGQKNFILECVRKLPCNYEQALQYANAFGQSIQDGQVVALAKQHEAFPPQKPLVPVVNPAPAPPQAVTRDNGGDPVAETCQEETEPDKLKGSHDPYNPPQGKK